jgi:hypothetical protein
VEKLLFNQQLEIDSLQAQIAAIDASVREQKAAGQHTPQEEEYWRETLNQLGGTLEQLRQLEKELKETLKEEKLALTVSGGAGSQEGDIRAQFREVVAHEAELGALLMDGAEAPVKAEHASVELKRQKAEELLGRLDVFNDHLRTEVDAEANKMRGEILMVKAEVAEYSHQAGAYESEAGEMAAVLTHNALKGVRDQFYDVVLRADVGMIDLAWQLKQDKTDAVSILVRKQKADLKSLDDEFADVLRDVE